jgi:hypothetical protein
MGSSQTSRHIILVGADGAPPPIQTKLDAAYIRVREAGYTLDIIPLHPENLTAELDDLKNTIRSKECAGFVVGTGLRIRVELGDVFERIVNAANEARPGVKFGFPQGPDDLHDCVVRNFGQ